MQNFVEKEDWDTEDLDESMKTGDVLSFLGKRLGWEPTRTEGRLLICYLLRKKERDASDRRDGKLEWGSVTDTTHQDDYFIQSTALVESKV